MKTEKIRRALELINVIYAGDVYREALAELATLIDGCAWEEAAKEKIAALEKRVADFEEGDEMHFRLVELQRSRMRGAEKAWQVAHNKPHTWPDLGELIEWMQQQIEALREALEFCSVHLTNDPLAAHERIRAALSATPAGKALVDVERLREACTNLEMAPAGPNEIYRCLLCDHHSLRRDGIRHTDDCWLGNILKTASEGGENV